MCVSPWESHLWPEFLLLGSAAQLSPGEREVELGRERRRQPVLRRISGEDFLLAASSSHKSNACKVPLAGESTDSLGYFLRKMFFFTFVWYQIIYWVSQKISLLDFDENPSSVDTLHIFTFLRNIVSCSLETPGLALSWLLVKRKWENYIVIDDQRSHKSFERCIEDNTEGTARIIYARFPGTHLGLWNWWGEFRGAFRKWFPWARQHRQTTGRGARMEGQTKGFSCNLIRRWASTSLWGIGASLFLETRKMSTNRRRGVINVVSGLTAPHESNYLPDGAIGPLLPHDVLLWRGRGAKTVGRGRDGATRWSPPLSLARWLALLW